MEINEIFLRACLAEDDKEFERHYEKIECFENLDLLDGNSGRLVPYYLHQLDVFKLNSRHQLRLKTISKYHWLKTQMLLSETNRVIELLKGIGITPLIYKGMSINRIYPDKKLRPSSDMDVLIDYHEFHRALEVLKNEGYTYPKVFDTLLKYFPKKNYTYNGHAVKLFHKQKKLELDLHWNMAHMLSEEGLSHLKLNCIEHPFIQGALVPRLEHELVIAVLHAAHSMHQNNFLIDIKKLLSNQNMDLMEVRKFLKIAHREDQFEQARLKLETYGLLENLEYESFDCPLSRRNMILPKIKNQFVEMDILFPETRGSFRYYYLLAEMILFKSIWLLLRIR